MQAIKTLAMISKYIAILMMSAATLIAQAPNEGRSLQVMRKRVYEGDKQALLEAERFSLPEVAPFLVELILDHETDSERTDIARSVLAKMRGHGEYFRTCVLADPENRTKKRQLFEVMMRLNTKESVKTLAYFLNNDSTTAEVYSGVFTAGDSDMAIGALARMHLPGAPTGDTTLRQEGDVQKWRQWWAAHQAEYQTE